MNRHVAMDYPPSPPAPVGITVWRASPESQLSLNLESEAPPPMLLRSRNLEESPLSAPVPQLTPSDATPPNPASNESGAPPVSSDASPPNHASKGSGALPVSSYAPPPPGSEVSQSVSTSKGSGALVGGLVAAGVVLVAAALVYFLLRRRRRRQEGKDRLLSESRAVSLSTMENIGKEGNKHKSLQSQTTPSSHVVLQLQESRLHSKTQTSTTSSSVSTGDYVQLTIEQVGVRTFTKEELSMATNEFSQDNFIGRGGFGSVYKGVLPVDGIGVAIKQLKVGSFQGEREFITEINVISRVHHRNLVTLVGYCISGPERLLVYEYVENNSLAFHLQGKETPLLDWETRMSIALGAAKGIAYLHEECHPKIIHRDIKSTNILLDANFKAKVADFGLAKFVSDDITYVSTRIMGTFGYLAPEYGSSGRLTLKSDVFSFGVVLLELITGRQPINLVEWASLLLDQALEDGKFDTELVDPELADNYDYEEMNRMVTCAAVCIHRFPDYRPQMSQVVQALEGNISPEKLKADARRPRTRRSS